MCPIVRPDDAPAAGGSAKLRARTPRVPCSHLCFGLARRPIQTSVVQGTIGAGRDDTLIQRVPSDALRCTMGNQSIAEDRHGVDVQPEI